MSDTLSKWNAGHQFGDIFDEAGVWICEAHTPELAQRIVTAVNNYEPLVEFLRYMTEGSCMGETPELTSLDCGSCEYCSAKALLADIDKESS